MITKIKGRLVALQVESATIGVAAFEYEVLVPDSSRRRLQERIGEEVSLHTIDYVEGNPTQGRLTPRLVGFTDEVEREFFELFCSVDGVGVRKALRAMVRPVREIAVAIVEQDGKLLETLPGIGAATADRIIAKLKRKMSRYALMVAGDAPRPADVAQDVVQAVFQALLRLGHSEPDARRMVDQALASKKKYKDEESLLKSVYEAAQA
ncbi:MAG: Holliday junction branch migration protein RuvA [Pirellulaceae bacterium]|jgi:Holliday junction DNA helicase RuvA|nr:Holliday junction branch migration protein RuvA [Pirellulaceae bacterium]MDP7018614.1 Holliday junction branch migration protein RuvA [Pirellulaceae bacterium]